ncbi:MAG: hypothetical protein MI919_10885, partial [Holophagales bacterium]|nr:hypothetical protein [Holophagales bacterium]
YYDPMIAKLVVYGADREQAIRRLSRALTELRVEGIRTSVPLFQRILADDDFRAGRLDITMLERKLASGEWMPDGESDRGLLPVVAAAIAHAEGQTKRTALPGAGARDRSSGHRPKWRAAGRLEAVGGS